jgi:thymidylate kinase
MPTPTTRSPDPGLGFDRIRSSGQPLDRIERAGADFHARVAAVFRQAAGPGIMHLDAGLSPDEVLLRAWAVVGDRRRSAPAEGSH